MFGSEVIDVGIGMALLFLFMSLMATALREIIENFVKSRSKDLEHGLMEIFQGNATSVDSQVKQFYEHPVITSLYRGAYVSGGRNLPSYIPRQSFSLALLDILAKASETGNPLSIDNLRAELAAASPPNGVQRVVLTAIGVAQGDLNAVRKALEDWYDGTMDRVSGWYARRTGRVLGILGLGAAVFFNVDAITVAEHLIHDKALRAAALSQAEHYTNAKAASAADADSATPPQGDDKTPQTIDALRSTLKDIGFPMGWRVYHSWIYPEPQTCTLRPDPAQPSADGAYECGFGRGWIVAAFGWLITAIAIMLGAPFWFDVLNKFMVIRSTIKPKEKSPDEASADPQPAAAQAEPPEVRDAASSNAADDALQFANASAAASLAARDQAFEPHAWTDPADPQRGVM